MWLNYDEHYAVSEDGQVMNRKTNHILKNMLGNRGRFRVDIYGKTIEVHRLVAGLFCPKIDVPKLEVDHINRDCTDNRAANLRWCDASTNMRNKNSTNIYKHTRGYRVRFRVRGEIIYCKYFKTMEEAIAARDAFKLTDEYLLA